jgi:hypothetical protein
MEHAQDVNQDITWIEITSVKNIHQIVLTLIILEDVHDVKVVTI